jgi:hypothetical protein
MIARIRGEHDTRWGRWRPSASRGVAIGAERQTVAAASDVAPLTPAARRHGPGRSRHGRRALRWLAVLLAVTTVGSLAAHWSRAEFPPASAQAGLPVTPRAWLDAYEAAAVDNPGRVCSELFAPALAQAYARAVHGSCADYFRRITSFSVVVRRVLAAGDTAVLELRQTVRPRDRAVVLDRRRAGWQAVDLLTGTLAR